MFDRKFRIITLVPTVTVATLLSHTESEDFLLFFQTHSLFLDQSLRISRSSYLSQIFKHIPRVSLLA